MGRKAFSTFDERPFSCEDYSSHGGYAMPSGRPAAHRYDTSSATKYPAAASASSWGMKGGGTVTPDAYKGSKEDVLDSLHILLPGLPSVGPGGLYGSTSADHHHHLPPLPTGSYDLPQKTLAGRLPSLDYDVYNSEMTGVYATEVISTTTRPKHAGEIETTVTATPLGHTWNAKQQVMEKGTGRKDGHHNLPHLLENVKRHDREDAQGGSDTFWMAGSLHGDEVNEDGEGFTEKFDRMRKEKRKGEAGDKSPSPTPPSTGLKLNAAARANEGGMRCNDQHDGNYRRKAPILKEPRCGGVGGTLRDGAFWMNDSGEESESGEGFTEKFERKRQERRAAAAVQGTSEWMLDAVEELSGEVSGPSRPSATNLARRPRHGGNGRQWFWSCFHPSSTE